MKPRLALAVLAVAVALPALAADPCETAADLGAQAAAAQSLAKSGKFADAQAGADAVLAACPTHPLAVAALGESLFGLGRHDDLVSRMSAALKGNAALAYAYYWRGKAYNAKKQAARMVDDFEAFLKLAPSAPEAPAVKQLLAALK